MKYARFRKVIAAALDKAEPLDSDHEASFQDWLGDVEEVAIEHVLTGEEVAETHEIMDDDIDDEDSNDIEGNL